MARIAARPARSAKDFMVIHRQTRRGPLWRINLPLCFRLFFRDGRFRAPTVSFLAGTEAGEVAAARWTAVRSGAAAKHDQRPAGRVIVLLAPGSQLLTIAARTAGELPRSGSPHAGSPSGAAAAAAKRVNTEESAKLLGKVLFVRNPYVPGSTLWTG